MRSTIGEIHVHEFVSLDGVFENPSWTAPFGFDPAMGEEVAAITSSATGILLGRATFEMFAPAWSGRTADDDPGAPFFNDTTKHVVSSTLRDAESVWAGSRVVGGYDVATLRELKDATTGALYVSGSGTLVRAMLADGLVDHLHLFVYPVVLGAGQRLLGDPMPQTTLALAGSTAYDNGVVHLDYAAA